MTFDVVFGVIFVEVAMCTIAPGMPASSLPTAKLVPIAGIVAVVSSPSVPAIVVLATRLALVEDDGGNRARGLGVLDLDRERARPALHERDVAAPGTPAKSRGLTARGRAVGRGARRQHEVDRRQRGLSRRPSPSSS